MKKWICALLIICITASVAGCVGKPAEPTTPVDTANTQVPADTDVVLTINKENGNKLVFGIGTELDPLFFSENVGLNGISNGTPWECKEEDWALFEQRMADMNLKRIRVMLRPSWYVIDEANTKNGVYNWETLYMESLYKVLDTAQKLEIKVNITMWGIDHGTSGFMRRAGESHWVTVPDEKYEDLFVTCFADCIKYLMEERNYSCISEVTLYNEPNTLYSGYKAAEEYCALCVKMHDVFIAKGIRDKVLFNLSDDAREHTWLAKTLMYLDGIIDVSNSHVYTFGDTYDSENKTSYRDMSNREICYDLANYNLNQWKQWNDEYPDVPHMWGEFGTLNNNADEFKAPERGIDIARISLNFFNMGSQGMSYWILFNQYYARSDFDINKMSNMGLWAFADEGYQCYPVYYAYSMLTRFVEESDAIFPIVSDEDHIVAVAFRQGDKWSYCVVNNGDVGKKVSFVNMDQYPGELTRYVYDEANVPTDNQVIGASGTVVADGRVITDTIAPRSFVIYTNK